MVGARLDARCAEVELNADLWIGQCADCLTALHPRSPLDGTDWADVANDLYTVFKGRLSPQFAARTYAHVIEVTPERHDERFESRATRHD